MNKTKQVSEVSISPELDALFDNARPIEELDLKGLAQAFEGLEQAPDYIADTRKAAFVEDVLRALDENQMPKSELARRLGKTRQQLSYMLNEDKLNNFTIETMAQISTALGRKLFVRMLAPDEAVQIQHNTVEQAAPRTKLRDLLAKNWSLPNPRLKPAELKKAKQAVEAEASTDNNVVPFESLAA